MKSSRANSFPLCAIELYFLSFFIFQLSCWGADSNGLTIGSKHVDPSTPAADAIQFYLNDGRYLTVPQGKWTDPAFVAGTNVTDIHKLDDLTRLEIYDKMISIPEIFNFETRVKALLEFDMRMGIIKRMIAANKPEEAKVPVSHWGYARNAYTDAKGVHHDGVPATIIYSTDPVKNQFPSKFWQAGSRLRYPVEDGQGGFESKAMPHFFELKPQAGSTKEHPIYPSYFDAVRDLEKSYMWADCMVCINGIILESAAEVLSDNPTEFENIHKKPEVPPEKFNLGGCGLLFHSISASSFHFDPNGQPPIPRPEFSAFCIPGDRTYLRNPINYKAVGGKVGAQNLAWRGENYIYLGGKQFQGLGSNWTPQLGGQPETASEARTNIYIHYTELIDLLRSDTLKRTYQIAKDDPNNNGVEWTKISRIKVDSSKP